MSLTCIASNGVELISPAVSNYLAHVRSEHQTVTLVVPHHTAAVYAKMALAQQELSFGIEVTTLDGWVDHVWELWGDGSARAAHMQLELALKTVIEKDTSAPPSHNNTHDNTQDASYYMQPGVINLMARIANIAAPQVVRDASHQKIAEYVQEACQLLQAHHVQPRSCIKEKLLSCPELSREQIVLVGFSQMLSSDVAWLAQVARVAEVVCFFNTGEGPAFEAPRMLQQALEQAYGEPQTAKDPKKLFENHAPQQQDPSKQAAKELTELAQALYIKPGTMHATGAVALLEALGSLVEPQLISEVMTEGANEGYERAVVVAPDVKRAFHDLSPKLAAQRIRTRATWREQLKNNTFINLYLGFANQVIRLVELAQTWEEPSPHSTQQLFLPFKQEALKDRSWLPPRAIVDFLLQSPLGLPKATIYTLDKRWRGKRDLTPKELIADLEELLSAHEALTLSFNALKSGDRVQAAQELLRLALAQKSGNFTTPLLAFLHQAHKLGEVIAQLGGEPQQALRASWRRFEDIILAATYTEHLERGGQGGTAQMSVEIISQDEAVYYPKYASDICIAYHQTADETAAPHHETAYSAYLKQLGIYPVVAPDQETTFRDHALVCLPKSFLGLEYAHFTARNKQQRPSSLVEEIMHCYVSSEELRALPPRPEKHIWRNVRLNTKSQYKSEFLEEEESAEHLLSAEEADLAARSFELKEGDQAHLGLTQTPRLSVTAIENYLKCPRYWFAANALGVHGIDTSSILDEGTLMHEVLQQTLLEATQGAQQGTIATQQGAATTQQGATTTQQGTATTPSKELLLDLLHKHIQKTMNRALNRATADAALQDQSNAEDEPSSFLPHTTAEVEDLEAMYEGTRTLIKDGLFTFAGFEPRYFELPLTVDDYAGIPVSAIVDRIDVDQDGNALILDYKTTRSKDPYPYYKLLAADTISELTQASDVLRPQLFIYASLLDKLKETYNIKRVVGALYLPLGPVEKPRPAGYLEESFAHALYNATPYKTDDLIYDGTPFPIAFKLVEDLIRPSMQRLLSGFVGPDPRDSDVCRLCPLDFCPYEEGSEYHGPNE